MTSAQTRSRSRLSKKDVVSEAPITPVEYLMTDSGQKWREPVIRRLNELTALQPGWDGYEGVSVTFESAYFAMEVLEACCYGDDPTPQIVPGTSGDLQIEWHLERGDIELHILGPNEVRAWHIDENTGFDGEEVSLTNDFNIVLRWIRNLTEPTRVAIPASSR
jgi:hypothetical protein